MRDVRLLILIVATVLLAACGGPTGGGGGGDATVDTVSITNVPSSNQVQVGSTVDLDATVTGSAGVSQEVSWTSSDESLAMVNSDGVVTGVSVGNVTITATSEVDSSKSDTATLAVVGVPTTVDCSDAGELPRTIATPQVLALDCYIISGVVDVSAALTVPAGTVMVAEQFARLDIEAGGALIAKGSATNPIVFRGENPSRGFWYGINVAALNTANELDYVQVSDGGYGNYANLYVQSSGSVKVTNSSFNNSSTSGIVVENGGQLTAFSSNTFSSNGETAIEIPANLVGVLDSASNYAGTTGAGNVVDAIDVRNGTVTTDQAWAATNAPYRLNGVMDIEAAVTVQAGANFSARQFARIDVEAGGSLKAVGTASERISFAGENASRNFWYGINLVSSSSENELSYVDISDGGYGNYASLYIQSSGSTKITNSSFNNSGTSGIVVENSGEISSFSGNSFANNGEAALLIPAYLAGMMDTSSSYTNGNVANVIDLRSGAVATDQTWAATGAPYRLNGVMDIEADIVVSPGATFVATQFARIDIEATGSLKAVGNSTNTISFSGVDSSKGFWYGLNFVSTSGDNQLDYVSVSGGGYGNFANIYVQSTASISVTNSTITNSSTYGLDAEGGASVTPSTAAAMTTQNSFSGNTEGPTDGLP